MIGVMHKYLPETAIVVTTLLLSWLGATAAEADAWATRKPPVLKEQTVKAMAEAIPARAAAKPNKERRILVFWRCDGFFHGSGIAGGNEALRLMGEKTGAYKADFSAVFDVFTPGSLARYDAVVLNNSTRLKMNPEQRKALLDFVRGGKGLVGFHGASDNFHDWPEGARMIGGLFDGHPWGGGGTWAVKIDAPEHPLTKPFGGKGFKIKDEIYQLKDPYTRADRRVLLSLDLSDSATGSKKGKRKDRDYAIAWIKREGEGRVFYSSFGHAENVYTLPEVLEYTLNGIQYALGDLSADDSPQGR
jgi:type 1 glutamine amidotransferase